MPDRHFYLLRHHILFYIKFLLFCSLAPDEIRILYGKNKGFPQKSMIFVFWGKMKRLSPPLSHRLNNWFYLESTNRRTKILYEIECDVRANKNADQAFSMQRLSSHSISYNIFVLRLFPLINQYMKSLFYRCNWKKVHVILK